VQNIDPDLLRHHLLQSVYWLHGQPPLWNLGEGLVLKLFPGSWTEVFHASFLLLGLAELLAFYALLRGLGAGRWAATALAAFLAVTPAFLVYENHFFYDYPTLVLLTVATLAVYWALRRPTALRWSLPFAVMAVLTLSRTLFQVGWMVVALLGLLVACRGGRRALLLGASVPLLLVCGVYVKNWVEFGVPSTSSWTGMGLARPVEDRLSQAEREQLVRAGKLHRVSFVRPLSALADYRHVRAVGKVRNTGIPILDRPAKTTDDRNLHNLAYIRISRQYLEDDLWLIRHRTSAYLTAIKLSFSQFFWPPDYTYRLKRNVDEISPWEHAFRLVVYGSTSRLNRSGIVLVAAYLVAGLYGLWLALRRLRPGAGTRTLTLLFAWWTVVYVAVVGNLAELGENFRFRLALDPLVLALLTALAADIVASSAAGRAPAGAER
jgi:hypothetical protein